MLDLNEVMILAACALAGLVAYRLGYHRGAAEAWACQAARLREMTERNPPDDVPRN